MSKGTLAAIIAYILWGLYPIYFKLLVAVPPFQTTAHRIVWAFIIMFLVLVVTRQLKALIRSITRRVFLIYLVAGLFVGVNWTIYIWAVVNDYILDASLGYFINPLLSVLLGLVFLRERLRPLQWLPVALAAAGVTYLTLSHGRFPWVALSLAFSFAMYGLVKKLSPLLPAQGLALETSTIFPLALGYLLVMEARGTGAFGHMGLSTSLLLAGAGLVTIFPLILFAYATQKIPLTMVGLLQYFTPTLQFLAGYLLYGEVFDTPRVIGFSFIWVGLIIFTAEGFLHRRNMAVTVRQVST